MQATGLRNMSQVPQNNGLFFPPSSSFVDGEDKLRLPSHLSAPLITTWTIWWHRKFDFFTLALFCRRENRCKLNRFIDSLTICKNGDLRGPWVPVRWFFWSCGSFCAPLHHTALSGSGSGSSDDSAAPCHPTPIALFKIKRANISVADTTYTSVRRSVQPWIHAPKHERIQGTLGARPPLPPRFLSKSGNFEQILGSRPPWSQNSATPPDQNPGSAPAKMQDCRSIDCFCGLNWKSRQGQNLGELTNCKQCLFCERGTPQRSRLCCYSRMGWPNDTDTHTHTGFAKSI